MSRELFHNYRLFEQFNAEKIKRATLISPIKARIAFKLIPYLINTNLRTLPGYINTTEPPCRIEAYQFSEEIKKTVNQYFPDNNINETSINKLFKSSLVIESILLMGSTGSTAQGEKSDFDYWICFDGTKAQPEILGLLKNKLSSIEVWAQDYDMEVHFFATDINMVQKNDFGEITKESVGTALGKILKEEFYRTLIHVSGKTPLWWIIPPGSGKEDYNKHKEELDFSMDLEPNSFVDLGNVTQISYDEYLGAALWQMNKALESPYKSVLKMALLESFMDPESSHELLCETLKKKLFSLSSDSMEGLDSYKIMFDKILNYYTAIGRVKVVNLLRRCFYIKVSEKITHSVTKEDTYKGPIMREYVRQWGWSEEICADLNNYSQWGFNKMLKLGDEVHTFLLQTYKTLNDHSRKEPVQQRKISDKDLTILGRKLFSFYSKKPDKVVPLKNPFDKRIYLDSLSFSVSVDSKRQIVWSVYRGQVYKNKLALSTALLLKKSSHIVELIVWIVFNGLCDANTTFYLIPSSVPVSLKEIQRLAKELILFFPRVSIADISNDDLLSNPVKTKIFAVLNFSNHTWVKKVEEASLIYFTNWGEFFCKTVNGIEGVKTLIQYTTESPAAKKSNLSDFYKIFVPVEAQLGDTINKINEIVLKRVNKI